MVISKNINTKIKFLAGSKDVEYRLAQSGDATCSGLENSEFGSRIMTLKRFGQAERCDFPKWFKEPKHWHSLNGELSYNVHQKYVYNLTQAHIYISISNDKWISMSWEISLELFKTFFQFSTLISLTGTMVQSTLRRKSQHSA